MLPNATFPELSAVAEKFGVPAAKIDRATRAYLGRVEGEPRVPLRVAAGILGVSTAKAERIFWAAEPVVFPDLRLADRAAIVRAFGAGVRDDRIAARAGLGVAAVESIFREETGHDPRTVKRSRGRGFAETRAGVLTVAEGTAYRAAVRETRASEDAPRGDRAVASAARALQAERAAQEDAPAPAEPTGEAPTAPAKRSRRTRGPK